MLLAAGAWASAQPGAETQEPVPLYTNADLLRFGPPSTDPRPVTTMSDADWDSIAAFLARADARLDAERSYELERRRVSYEERAADRQGRPRFAYPFYGFDARSSGHRYRPGSHGKPHPSQEAGLGRPIVPLHARPSLAQLQWAKATRHSGVDAFPSNARRRD